MLVYGRGTFIDLHSAATWREGDLVERCMAIVGTIYFNYIGASLASGHHVNTYESFHAQLRCNAASSLWL